MPRLRAVSLSAVSLSPVSISAVSLITAALAVALAAVAVVASPRLSGSAGAEVVHDQGFDATVLGWPSWYGSYRLAGLGSAWCVDHGLSAPDVEHGYQPATLDDHAPDTRRAMAWLLGRWPVPPGDRVGAAATMLALHDLMGSRYPGGVLDVDRLTPAQVSGFGAGTEALLVSARTRKADAVAHSTLVPPLALTAETAHDAGLLIARVTDASGAPVAGATVQLAGVDASAAVTGSDGSWSRPLDAGTTGEPLHLTATAPDLDLHAWRPTRARAQRVAVPSMVHLEATASPRAEATHPPPPPPPPAHHLLTVTKTGDATAYLPVGGARFTVSGDQVAGLEVVPGIAVDLAAGRYTVTETAAPPGYATAGPWEVDLSNGDASLAVEDHALRGTLEVAKHDAGTGAGVAGAVLMVSYDADHDGRFETAVGDLTTTEAAVEVGDLLPGDYQVVERTPPPGYAPATGPVIATVPPAGRAAAHVTDDRLPPPPPTPVTVQAAAAAPPPPAAPAPPTTTSTTSTTSTTAAAATAERSPPEATPQASAELPATGSATTRPLALAGLALIFAGAGAVVLSRRFPW